MTWPLETNSIDVLVAICAAFFLVCGAIAVQDAVYTVQDVRQWLKRRRSRAIRSARTPAAEIERQSLRTNDPWMDPHMPDESEIRRYGRADYGPRRIDPGPPRTPPDNGGQRRTRPDRRGLVAGGVAVLVLLCGAGLAAYILLSGGGSRPAAATTSATAASAPAVQLDSYARNACQLLHKAEGEWQGDKMAQLDASLSEYNAETAAARSSVAELAGIAKSSVPDSSNSKVIASQLRDWCSAHWSPGQ